MPLLLVHFLASVVTKIKSKKWTRDLVAGRPPPPRVPAISISSQLQSGDRDSGFESDRHTQKRERHDAGANFKPSHATTATGLPEECDHYAMVA